MPISIIHKGRVLDFHYKKLNDFTYAFYVGDIYVGQVFRAKRYWSCVGTSGSRLYPQDGFKNRYYASEFLLKVESYREDQGNYNEVDYWIMSYDLQKGDKV